MTLRVRAFGVSGRAAVPGSAVRVLDKVSSDTNYRPRLVAAHK